MSSEPISGQGFEHNSRTGGVRPRAVIAATLCVAVTASLVVAAGAGAAERKKRSAARASTTATTTPTVPPDVSAVPKQWLVLGDSVAESFAPMLQMEALKYGIKVNRRTRPGCGMITAIPVNPDGSPIPWGASCAEGTAAYQTSAIARYGADVVVWHSSWEGADQLYDGVMLALGTPEGDAALIGEIEASIARMTSRGARVVLVTNAPRTPFNNIGLGVPEDLLRRVNRLNQILAQVAEAHGEDVELVDLAAIVCPTGPPCPAYVDGVPLRPRDGSHFEGFGPGWLAPRLLAAIVTALTRGPTSTVQFQ